VISKRCALARCLLPASSMSRPRQVLPGQFYLLTRRCTQRQFLLRPDAETNNAFTYCLAEAAQRFGIDVVLPFAASNHHHTIIFDRHGRYPEFLEHFHKLLAKCMNARWGRWENLWAAEEPCVTCLLDTATVIAKLVYAASNPVKDLLVERASQWPGVNGYRELLARQPLRAKRPRFFFKPGGAMPAEVTLALVIPAELGDADDVIAQVKAGVEAVEQAMREHRRQTGAKLVTRRGVLAQSWKSCPRTIEPRRRLRPRFAGALAVRIPALIAFAEFLAAYRNARRDWLAGRKISFPRGTYWLARFTPAPVAEARAAPVS
jgi:putative transposase